MNSVIKYLKLSFCKTDCQRDWFLNSYLLKISGIILFTLFLNFQAHSSIEIAIERIERNLGITIQVDEVVSGSWQAIQYQLITDTTALHQYLLLLEREYAKYPTGYFNRIGISTIAIGEDLMFNDQIRAAIPDPYKGILFLSVDKENSETYLVHVMHHELHHCAEYRHWKSMNYRWKSWSMVNQATFNYHGSGASAYDDPSVDWYRISKPYDGFINLYSTTAEEEDRAEIVAIIMTEAEKPYLDNYLTQDKILQQKVLLMKILLTEISGESDCYWNRVFE